MGITIVHDGKFTHAHHFQDYPIQLIFGLRGTAKQGTEQRAASELAKKLAALPARYPYIGAAEKNVYLFTPTQKIEACGGWRSERDLKRDFRNNMKTRFDIGNAIQHLKEEGRVKDATKAGARGSTIKGFAVIKTEVSGASGSP
jgi:hypothetical protein